MDSVIFQAMAEDLNRRLSESRLDRVIQISAGTLVFKLWTGREKLQLLLKAEGQGAFYLTRQGHVAPARPPRFCQLLRARLRHLLDVRTEPLDRVVHFRFSGPEREQYDLILEALGTKSNLFLVDASGQIVDLLWRQQGVRKLLPGEAYSLPEQKERVSLFGDSETVVTRIEDGLHQGTLARVQLAPMSQALARAIQSVNEAGQSIASIVSRVQDTFEHGVFMPCRVTWDGRDGHLPLVLDGAGFDMVEEYPDLSALVEESLTAESWSTSKELAPRLAGVVRKRRKHLQKRLQHIAAETVRHSEPERFRMIGDLLLANLHRFKRGDRQVELEDYYQSPPQRLTVELDSKANPQQNAARYFQRYRKAQRAGDHLGRRLRETEEEIKWLDQVELALEEATGGDDLYQVQLELEGAGLLKQAKGKLAKRRPVKPEDHLMRALSPGGWPLYWGRNGRTNDYVSRKMTGPHDLWFHACQLPGTHLVLKCGDKMKEVSEDDVLYAASLAAGYSRGSESGKVEVMVAPGKAVSKPKGARPGLVTVNSYRTVMVAPTRLKE